VREVEPATSAAEADIRPGDLLVEVAQQGVSGKQGLRQLLKAERGLGKRFALLTVSRDGVTLFKPLRLYEQPVDTAMRLEGQ
jgi:S1-C subfamily serine protease